MATRLQRRRGRPRRRQRRDAAAAGRADHRAGPRGGAGGWGPASGAEAFLEGEGGGRGRLELLLAGVGVGVGAVSAGGSRGRRSWPVARRFLTVWKRQEPSDGAGARGVEAVVAVLPPQPHEREHGLVALLGVGAALEVHRGPAEDGYRTVTRHGAGDTVAPLAHPDNEVDVADLLALTGE